ncbi:hypothetical protein DESPIGER_1632 [Desulfovibrio piger]|uniref:Uncharacterized protein n=1 Tax=Desulfovibrio piger TaxID=901 RepID=A0A1K1LFI7_9BACT|nr:hypothetical protein DESPIGER_1632 [Desulfovibrio piger]
MYAEKIKNYNSQQGIICFYFIVNEVNMYSKTCAFFHK